MISIENECVDCGLPCLYTACSYYKVTHFYCDECNEEVEDLYWFGTEQLCPDCILKQLEKVEFED